jgi:threonine aldolase
MYMFKGIDLSSDTATKPTHAMKVAMMDAMVGDEQKDEDPTTLQLQEMISEMLGFDHAVFFTVCNHGKSDCIKCSM